MSYAHNINDIVHCIVAVLDLGRGMPRLWLATNALYSLFPMESLHQTQVANNVPYAYAVGKK